MKFNKGRYNSYRKRHFNVSKSKAKEYSTQMEEIEIYFDNSDDWNISTMLDSAYKYYDNYKVRLSNHSANNQYHDIYNDNHLLMINIKSSKLDFISRIENELNKILEVIDTLELDNYRFINVVNGNINCFLKGYKTKKEVFKWK